jgi:hypothetical protein
MTLTRVLSALAVVLVLVCGFLGLTQASSFVLHQEEPAMYWPSSNTDVVGAHVRGRGYITHASRTEWASFAGGGPGGAK